MAWVEGKGPPIFTLALNEVWYHHQRMQYSRSALLHEARARSMETQGNSQIDYEHMAELFRRFDKLDGYSLGPELARLQNLACPAAAPQGSIWGKVQWAFFRAIHPFLGRFLRAASLASPYQAAYDLAVNIQRQQLVFENKVQAELEVIRHQFQEIEQELRSAPSNR